MYSVARSGEWMMPFGRRNPSATRFTCDRFGEIQ
jgi:hypothetical protein